MIPYILFEMQTNREDVTAHLTPINFTDENEAFSAYHLKVGSAYVSEIYMHTVMLCTADGRCIDSKCIMHNINGEEEE